MSAGRTFNAGTGLHAWTTDKGKARRFKSFPDAFDAAVAWLNEHVGPHGRDFMTLAFFWDGSDSEMVGEMVGGKLPHARATGPLLPMKLPCDDRPRMEP